MKKWVLAVALLSLAISMGCRNIVAVSQVKVVVSNPGNLSVLYVTQVVQFTATVTGTSNTGVTWSLSGAGCTGSGSGTLSSSGLYTAPPAPAPNPGQVCITATSQADSTRSDSAQVTVKDITVVITPNPENVGKGLTQQFTAVVIPDDAPQTVTWSIPPASCVGGPCGSIDASTGIYSAAGASPGATLSVQAAVPTALDPSGFSTASVTVVSSRLVGSSTYAFRFSGFDTSGAAIVRVGSFVVGADGKTISSGVEDELTSGGPQLGRTIINTSSASLNSNNQGTITLNSTGTGGPESNTYTMVLDANGDIQIIDSDGPGQSGSGVIEPFTGKFKDNTSLSGPFVFGFTGVDSTGKRVGYVGLANMDGLVDGKITSGLLDTNDDGTAGSASDLTGSYSMANGIGTMSLTSPTLGKTFNFNLYGVSGQLKANDPATLYAISTDANPGVSGTVVFQAPDKNNYNNATLKGTSVVSLTGADSTGANVSLTIVTTDGAGGLSGNFDQNNGGIIVDVGGPLSNPPTAPFSAGYTYSATGSGRYTFKLLGNPNSNPVVAPVPFVLYASGATKGFLLECNLPSCNNQDTSVMTGTMVPQSAPPKQNGIFSASNIPGQYAAATTSSGTKLVDPIAANLLLTWVNTETCTKQCVDGFQYDAGNPPPGETVTGAYTLQSVGYGTFTLTAPSAESYVIYAIDITHILAMDVDKTNANASIIFAQQ